VDYQLPKTRCLICGSEYTARGIGRHVPSCLKKRFENVVQKDATYYLLFIRPNFTKDYFLYLLLAQTTKLRELDEFLRAIWLECCGHMSAFFYGRFNEIPKKYSISEVGDISDSIIYHYDFGSTTELHIQIIGKYRGPAGLKKKIVILARNSQPIVPCDECGKRPAVQICTECQWSGGGWLCEQCAKEHTCEDAMFLPVCNSPRTGVCGYVGETREIRTDDALKNFLQHLKKAQQ